MLAISPEACPGRPQFWRIIYRYGFPHSVIYLHPDANMTIKQQPTMTALQHVTIVGVFEDRVDANHAIDDLYQAGFDDDQIGSPCDMTKTSSTTRPVRATHSLEPVL